MPKGEYLQYGGLAIIEGVMMRSPKHFSVACRAPNGEIVLRTDPADKGWLGRQSWLRLPFFRGPFALIDSIALGNRAITYSSEIQLDPKYAKDGPAPETLKAAVPPTKAENARKTLLGIFSMVALVLMVGLFIFLPQVLGEQLRLAGVTNERQLNLFSGILKLVLFIAYVTLIRRLHAIYRVFQFHGAEHKAINTMEAGHELTMENCRRASRLHPRCGTNFAVIVLLLDIAVMTFIVRYPLGYQNAHYLVNLGLRALINIPILVAVAGVAYEMIRLAGRFRYSWVVQMFFIPGLLTQYITTAPPDDEHLEVALTALRTVIAAEETDVPPAPPQLEPEPVATL